MKKTIKILLIMVLTVIITISIVSAIYLIFDSSPILAPRHGINMSIRDGNTYVSRTGENIRISPDGTITNLPEDYLSKHLEAIKERLNNGK